MHITYYILETMIQRDFRVHVVAEPASFSQCDME